MGSGAQDQVQDLRGKFENLKEAFDRGVVVQILEAVDAVQGIILTNGKRRICNFDKRLVR